MSWIKLEDKEPELGQLVAVNFIDGNKEICRYVKDIDGKNEFIRGGSVANKAKITHWIELEELEINKED